MKGIQSHDDGHDFYILRMVSIVQGIGNGFKENANQNHKQQRNKAYCQGRSRKGFIRVNAFLVGEAEEGSLHAEGQEDKKQGGVSIQVCYDTIASRFSGDFVGIQRNEQVVQKPADDAAQAVDGGLFC